MTPLNPVSLALGLAALLTLGLAIHALLTSKRRTPVFTIAHDIAELPLATMHDRHRYALLRRRERLLAECETAESRLEWEAAFGNLLATCEEIEEVSRG